MSLFIPPGVLSRQSGYSLVIPKLGLLSKLDGSIATSFYSDIAKTANSVEGGPVAVWEDQSGNGNDWVQATASLRPLANLSANRLYNNPDTGIPATTINDHLTGPDISGWTQGSFFARFQAVAAGAAGGIWGTTSWSSVNSTNHWSLTGAVGPHYTSFGVNGRGSAWADWASQAEAYTDLMTYEENVSTAGVVKIYIGGTERYSADLGITGFRSVPYLGCAVRAGAAQYSITGYYHKACMYNRIVSAAERAIINAWLES